MRKKTTGNITHSTRGQVVSLCTSGCIRCYWHGRGAAWPAARTPMLAALTSWQRRAAKCWTANDRPDDVRPWRPTVIEFWSRKELTELPAGSTRGRRGGIAVTHWLAAKPSPGANVLLNAGTAVTGHGDFLVRGGVGIEF